LVFFARSLYLLKFQIFLPLERDITAYNKIVKYWGRLKSGNVFDFEKVPSCTGSPVVAALNSFVYIRETGKIVAQIKQISEQQIGNPIMYDLYAVKNDGSVAGCALRETSFGYVDFYIPSGIEDLAGLILIEIRDKKQHLAIIGGCFKRSVGMNYSLDEQLSGDVWFDGKPIYVKSILFTVDLKAGYNSQPIAIPDIDFLVKFDFRYNLTTGFTNSGTYVTGTSASTVRCPAAYPTRLEVYINSVPPSAPMNMYFTLYYTKNDAVQQEPEVKAKDSGLLAPW
jgi:hypothetical protein